jgi:hypothetical protein
MGMSRVIATACFAAAAWGLIGGSIKNTSGETWDSGSVDYKYVSGTKMQKRSDIYDMSTSVKSGETVKIVVDMLGPSSTGWYSTTWALVQGSKTLCTLPVTLRVK